MLHLYILYVYFSSPQGQQPDPVWVGTEPLREPAALCNAQQRQLHPQQHQQVPCRRGQ